MSRSLLVKTAFSLLVVNAFWFFLIVLQALMEPNNVPYALLLLFFGSVYLGSAYASWIGRRTGYLAATALSVFLVALILSLNVEFDIYWLIIMVLALLTLLASLGAYKGANPKAITA